MPKTKTKKNQQPRRRGTETAVEVVVGDKRRHVGLVSIENNGQDECGRVVGTNGIRWAISCR